MGELPLLVSQLYLIEVSVHYYYYYYYFAIPPFDQGLSLKTLLNKNQVF